VCVLAAGVRRSHRRGLSRRPHLGPLQVGDVYPHRPESSPKRSFGTSILKYQRVPWNYSRLRAFYPLSWEDFILRISGFIIFNHYFFSIGAIFFYIFLFVQNSSTICAICGKAVSVGNFCYGRYFNKLRWSKRRKKYVGFLLCKYLVSSAHHVRYLHSNCHSSLPQRCHTAQKHNFQFETL